MKKIYLSNPGGKVFCLVGDLLIAAVTVWMILSSALRGKSLLFPILCAAFMLLLLLIYTYAVFSCAVLVDRSGMLITVKGMQHQEINISGVASVDTAQVTTGSLTTRVIRLLDSGGLPVASISTMVLTGGGVKNEPLAKRLAAAIGAEFIPTLEPWRYDKAARKKRDAEERAAKREATRKSKVRRGAAKSEAPPENEPVPDDFDENDALK